MKAAVDLSRPDFVFGLTWLGVLAVYVPFPTMLTPPIESSVATMLLINILTGPVIYELIRKAIAKHSGDRSFVVQPRLSLLDQKFLIDFLYGLIALWIAIWVVSIAYSGGLPLLWYFTGDKREYLDFGIPSVSGFGDMLRMFCSVICILLFLTTRRKWFLLLWALHMIPPVTQVSRGWISIMVLQAIGAFLLLQKLKARQLLFALVVIAFAAAMFILLGMLRGIGLQASDYAGVDQYFGGVPVGLYWVWTYVATPLGNVVYGVSLGHQPAYAPNLSLAYLVPTMFRTMFYAREALYTPLATDVFNATSLYAPLVTDFGIVITTAIVSLFIAVASYVHIKAKQGSLFYIALYPPLYASLGLSFFHIFMLTPGVVAVPVVCVILRKFMQKKHLEHRFQTSTVVRATTS